VNISEPFIRRPIATSLLMGALALVGIVAFPLLPVAPLPQVDFPTIQVQAQLAGASPDTMASTVAAPLERQFGQISGVTQLTSTSVLGATSITLQFDLSRNVDAAAQDVQAAITAAGRQLPTTLTSPPTYRKVNPADSPILILAAHSDTLPLTTVDDFADTVVAQQISQITGVAQVVIGGEQKPAVRVQVDPAKLQTRGLALEDVRTAIALATSNAPKGGIYNDNQSFTIAANDQLQRVADYENAFLAFRNGAPIRVRDIGQAVEGPQDETSGALSKEKLSILLIVFKQPGANVIETADLVKASLPQIYSVLPHAMRLETILDRTETIRASVRDVEFTLLLTIASVVLVVFLFLRHVRATLIPSTTVPLAMLGAFAWMYLMSYSLDNLSLMGLSIAIGFVVDDAIVVIENIYRHLENGASPMEAALNGSSEVGSTVFTISVSLMAVFIPLLLMGGIVGRLFREFAVTLSVAIAVSMVISLTATPMMCAYLLKEQRSHGWMYRISERAFNGVVNAYGRTLSVALRFRAVTLIVLLATVGLNVYLFIRVPKGFFPQQDNGRIQGSLQGDQDISFQAMDKSLLQMVKIIDADPAVDTVNGFTGGGNTARVFISLKPIEQRNVSADVIIARLRPKLAKVPGVTMFLQAAQDLRVGGRQSNAQYQFMMQGDNLADLTAFAPRMVEQLN